MAFVLELSDSYTWPVPVEVPVDGGRHLRQTFDAEFRRLPQERIEEVMELASESASVANMRAMRDLADEILCGWSGVQDGKGEEIPYSEAGKAKLLSIPGMAARIVEVFGESIRKERGKPSGR